MWLTAGQNFLYYDNFWKKSFITVGWGHEFLSNFDDLLIGNFMKTQPILTNYIFGELSIYGTRFMFLIYKFINQSLF